MKEKLEKVILCYGSKTAEDCIYQPFFANLNKIEKFEALRTVDVAHDSWDGPVGVVTTLLDNVDLSIKNTVAVVCGPPVMMKFGTMDLLKAGYKLVK